MPPIRGKWSGISNGSHLIDSSETGKMRPEPRVGTPFVRASRSWAGYDRMICSRCSGVKCSASSIVICVTCRSGDLSRRYDLTTSDIPKSGVKVR